MKPPTPNEQGSEWRAALGDLAQSLNGDLEILASQFSLAGAAIRSAAACACSKGNGTQPLLDAIWEECRRFTRTRMDDLAHRIEATADWDELVLPEAQKSILREIVAHVRCRNRVYESWGFARKGARGLGISALFAGASGTGKTMAAEVLARDLRSGSISHRPVVRWSASTLEKRRKICAGFSMPPKKVAQSFSSTRRTPCSASAAK